MVNLEQQSQALELWNRNEFSNDALIDLFEADICLRLVLATPTLSPQIKSELERWLAVLRSQGYMFLGSSHFLKRTIQHYRRLWGKTIEELSIDGTFLDQKAEALRLWNLKVFSNDALIELFETDICRWFGRATHLLSPETKSELDRWLAVLRSQGSVFLSSSHFLKRTIKHYRRWLDKERRRVTLRLQTYTNMMTLERLETLEQLESPRMAESIRGLVPFCSPAFGPRWLEFDPPSNQLITALSDLSKSNPEAARFAVLRLFAGQTLDEIASRTGRSLNETYSTWLEIQSCLNQSGVKTEAGIWLPVPSDDVLRLISENPRLLQQVSWREFERIIADLLARLGFQIELQQGTKDGGIDILALRGGPLGDHRYLIQAKRWTNKVGVEPVQQLLFLQGHYRATKGCLATTSTFTRGARQLAAEYRWQLDLKDLRGIQAWVAQAIRGA